MTLLNLITRRSDARPGVVYALMVAHQETGKVGVGYVGQTRQRPEVRLQQHRDTQPWGDRIVQMRILDKGVWSDAKLDRRELRLIRRYRPWHNITGNMGNPHRVPPWDAVAARQRREPGWVPPARTSRPALVRSRPAAVGGWSASYAGLWLVAAVVAGVWVARLPGGTAVDGLVVAPGAACAALMLARQQARSWALVLGRRR